MCPHCLVSVLRHTPADTFNLHLRRHVLEIHRRHARRPHKQHQTTTAIKKHHGTKKRKREKTRTNNPPSFYSTLGGTTGKKGKMCGGMGGGAPTQTNYRTRKKCGGTGADGGTQPQLGINAPNCAKRRKRNVNLPRWTKPSQRSNYNTRCSKHHV